MDFLKKIQLSFHPAAVVIFLFGVIVLVVSSTFPDLPEGYPGPGLFPRGIGMLLVLSTVLMSFGKGDNLSDPSDHKEGRQIWHFLVLIVVIFCFPLFYRLGNFFIALFICVGLVAILFRLVWWKSILISTLTCGAIYLLFIQVLRVPL